MQWYSSVGALIQSSIIRQASCSYCTESLLLLLNILWLTKSRAARKPRCDLYQLLMHNWWHASDKVSVQIILKSLIVRTKTLWHNDQTAHLNICAWDCMDRSLQSARDRVGEFMSAIWHTQSLWILQGSSHTKIRIKGNILRSSLPLLSSNQTISSSKVYDERLIVAARHREVDSFTSSCDNRAFTSI